MRILIIDDEQDIAESIRDILAGLYVVDIALTGSDGLYQSHINDYDLIILDYVMPDLDGVKVCQEIRASAITTPIIFLTGKYAIRDKVLALNTGADDYLVKPFSAQELKARVRSLLRRSNYNYANDILAFDSLYIDTLNRIVVHDKCKVPLRRKAFELLEYLARNKNRVLTRSMILEHVWEKGTEELSNTLEVHIKYLRDRIDKPFGSTYIRTVHGTGYSFSSSSDE